MATTLHARASSWYSARGNTTRRSTTPLGLTIASSSESCSGLRSSNTSRRVSNSLVQDWLRGFSRAELSGHPRLGLAAAHSFMAAGDVAAARQLAVAAAAAVERAGDTARVRSLRRRPRRHRGHGRTGGGRRDGRGSDTRLRRSSRSIVRGDRYTCSCTRPRCTSAASARCRRAPAGRGRRPQCRERACSDVDVPGAVGDGGDRAARLGDRGRPDRPGQERNRVARPRGLPALCSGVRSVGGSTRPHGARRRSEARSPTGDRPPDRARATSCPGTGSRRAFCSRSRR